MSVCTWFFLNVIFQTSDLPNGNTRGVMMSWYGAARKKDLGPTLWGKVLGRWYFFAFKWLIEFERKFKATFIGLLNVTLIIVRYICWNNFHLRVLWFNNIVNRTGGYVKGNILYNVSSIKIHWRSGTFRFPVFVLVTCYYRGSIVKTWYTRCCVEFGLDRIRIEPIKLEL